MISEEPIKAVNKPKCKGHPYAVLLWVLVTGVSLPIAFMFGTRQRVTAALPAPPPVPRPCVAPPPPPAPRPCVNAVNINGNATLVDAADGAILVYNKNYYSDDRWLSDEGIPYTTKLGYRLCPRGVK